MRFSPISKHCCFQGNSQERKAYLIRLWDSCESHFPLLLWLSGGSEKNLLRCLVLDFFRLQKDCTDPFPQDYSFPTLLFGIYPFSLILYLLGIIWVLKIHSRKMFQCWLFWTSSCALWSDWSIIVVGELWKSLWDIRVSFCTLMRMWKFSPWESKDSLLRR